MSRKFKIGIMGSAKRSGELPEVLAEKAGQVGREVALSGCILITGSCMGVPDIAAKAASKEGGLVLGYSPASNLKEHTEPPTSYPFPADNEVLIYTGYGKIGRNVLSIVSCDAVLFVGGGIGTLNEFTIAYHEGKVIGVLGGVGSVVEKTVKEKESFRETGSKVIIEDDPKKLVERVIEETEKNKPLPRKEIPITFKNERGKELAGVFHLPENKKPSAVIICHGFQNHKTDRKFVKLARNLRDEGILAFRFDFEGCGDSEGDPKEITVQKEVSDLHTAYKALLKECDIDHKKIAIVGTSLGSVVATLFIKELHLPVTNLVFWSQAFDQKGLFSVWGMEENAEEIEKNGFITKGDKEIGRDYYRENREKDYTPILSEINLPILLMQGEEDKDVPVEFSKKLAETNKQITLEVIPGADHKFKNYNHQEVLIKKTTDELKKHL